MVILKASRPQPYGSGALRGCLDELDSLAFQMVLAHDGHFFGRDARHEHQEVLRVVDGQLPPFLMRIQRGIVGTKKRG